ncbi:hypothetical protein [Futiania mangrovi]|uniref:Uncharacterized protein n=1 Tax=Futiania mangrovi TaxID=2959716 RepID=A0A9J6P9X3_9PROT|nr:hypothetical protein [Futiania mangrovii]MCP1336804.1 hypothetical protein [Futiania mangrovii]
MTTPQPFPLHAGVDRSSGTEFDMRLAETLDLARVTAALGSHLPGEVVAALLRSPRLRTRTLALIFQDRMGPASDDWLKNPIVACLLDGPATRRRLAGLCGAMMHARTIRMVVDARALRDMIARLDLSHAMLRFALKEGNATPAGIALSQGCDPVEDILASGWQVLATWRERVPRGLAGRLSLVFPEGHAFNNPGDPAVGARAPDVAGRAAGFLQTAAESPPPPPASAIPAAAASGVAADGEGAGAGAGPAP